MRNSITIILLLIGAIAAQERSISGSSRRSNRFSAGKSHAVNFNCPEDFGYYAHPSDCSQYYVCVFGGALLESCTGGLMYSHDLQTCDWPRNVVCDLTSNQVGISTVKITDPRTQSKTNSQILSATESLTPSASLSRGVDNAINARHSVKNGNNKAVFDDSSKARQGRLLPRQESSNNRNLNSGGFQAQETSSRLFNVVAATAKSQPSFPPSLPGPADNSRFASVRSSTLASVEKPVVTDKLNNNDTDYYYYYDDILYDDYYESTTTQRSASIRSPIRSRGNPEPKESVSPSVIVTSSVDHKRRGASRASPTTSVSSSSLTSSSSSTSSFPGTLSSSSRSTRTRGGAAPSTGTSEGKMSRGSASGSSSSSSSRLTTNRHSTQTTNSNSTVTDSFIENLNIATSPSSHNQSFPHFPVQENTRLTSSYKKNEHSIHESHSIISDSPYNASLTPNLSHSTTINPSNSKFKNISLSKESDHENEISAKKRIVIRKTDDSSINTVEEVTDKKILKSPFPIATITVALLRDRIKSLKGKSPFQKTVSSSSQKLQLPSIDSLRPTLAETFTPATIFNHNSSPETNLESNNKDTSQTALSASSILRNSSQMIGQTRSPTMIVHPFVLQNAKTASLRREISLSTDNDNISPSVQANNLSFERQNDSSITSNTTNLIKFDTPFKRSSIVTPKNVNKTFAAKKSTPSPRRINTSFHETTNNAANQNIELLRTNNIHNQKFYSHQRRTNVFEQKLNPTPLPTRIDTLASELSSSNASQSIKTFTSAPLPLRTTTTTESTPELLQIKTRAPPRTATPNTPKPLQIKTRAPPAPTTTALNTPEPLQIKTRSHANTKLEPFKFKTRPPTITVTTHAPLKFNTRLEPRINTPTLTSKRLTTPTSEPKRINAPEPKIIFASTKLDEEEQETIHMPRRANQFMSKHNNSSTFRGSASFSSKFINSPTVANSRLVLPSVPKRMDEDNLPKSINSDTHSQSLDDEESSSDVKISFANTKSPKISPTRILPDENENIPSSTSFRDLSKSKIPSKRLNDVSSVIETTTIKQTPKIFKGKVPVEPQSSSFKSTENKIVEENLSKNVNFSSRGTNQSELLQSRKVFTRVSSPLISADNISQPNNSLNFNQSPSLILNQSLISRGQTSLNNSSTLNPKFSNIHRPATITVSHLRSSNLKSTKDSFINSEISKSNTHTTPITTPKPNLETTTTTRRSSAPSPSPARNKPFSPMFPERKGMNETSSFTSQETGLDRGSSQASSKASPSGSPQLVGRTPQRLIRPSKKPAPASTRSNLITDVWDYPPRRLSPVYPQPPLDVKAQPCDKVICKLPDCFCGGKDVPGDMPPQNIPQMVLLTFDDSVNDLNKKLYIDLFEKGRVNPNGCPIAATFYVSHEWTDYSQVQNLYSDGHEIASHSITHSFGEQFSTDKWAKEIGGQREIMSAYGGVRMEDIRGMRAPFLAVGGNKMFRMLYDLNFTYDSSMPVYENRPPSWPYSLDYRIFHDCMIPPCPTNSFPGVWQVPMVMWQDLTGGRCSMGDACTTPPDAEGVYKMLIKNFERHYTTNRAPLGLFYHAAWFTTPHHKEGFIAFLDTITAMDDVWLVTNWQALQWVRDPTPLSQIKSFGPFQCDYPERPPRCNSPRVCNVWHKGSVRYLKTCGICPESYPWTGNTGVKSPLNDI